MKTWVDFCHHLYTATEKLYPSSNPVSGNLTGLRDQTHTLINDIETEIEETAEKLMLADKFEHTRRKKTMKTLAELA
jgi:hypothetical protein